jgi:hypothetical protein
MHQHLTASQTAAAGKRNAIVLTLGMSLNGGGLPEIISGDGFSEMEKEELAFRPFDTDTGLTASLSYSFEKFYCGLSLGYLFFSYSKQPIEKRYGTLGNTYPRGYDFKTRKVPILAIFGFKLGKTTGLEFAAGICPSSYAFKQTKLPGVPLGYYDPPVLRDENMRFTALQVSARFIVDILVHDTGIFQLNFEGGLLKNPQDPWPHLRIGLGAQWAFTHL